MTGTVCCPPDDMSSIYPLETNECYYNYSPKGKNKIRGDRMHDEDKKKEDSSRNLGELLECLNKSGV
jgi:hypothetical protein